MASGSRSYSWTCRHTSRGQGQGAVVPLTKLVAASLKLNYSPVRVSLALLATLLLHPHPPAPSVSRRAGLLATPPPHTHQLELLHLWRRDEGDVVVGAIP